LNVREWIEISRSSPVESFRRRRRTRGELWRFYFSFFFFFFFFFLSHLYFSFSTFTSHSVVGTTRSGHILSSGYYRREEKRVQVVGEGSCKMRCRDDTVRRGDWKSDSSPTKWFLRTTKVIFSQTNVNCCPGDCKLIKHKLILFGWFIYFFSLKAKSRQFRYNNNNILYDAKQKQSLIIRHDPMGFRNGRCRLVLKGSPPTAFHSKECILNVMQHFTLRSKL